MNITYRMVKKRLDSTPHAELLSSIERLQGIQKRHNHIHPSWKIASADLAWLFVEMERRQLISEQYVKTVGYDPFADDTGNSAKDVSEILEEMVDLV